MAMAFSSLDKTKILKLKSAISSYYSLQMKKLGDDGLQSVFFNSCVITGGCISSLYHGEAVNDIDLYAKTKPQCDAVKKIIIDTKKNLIKSSEVYNLEDKPEPLITANAITLNNDVQFVHMNTADECKRNFDFIHCMPWFDISQQKLYISEAQYYAIRDKKLIKNPQYNREVKSQRIDKYIKRGWTWETSQTTTTGSATSTLTNSVIDWKDDGTGFLGVVAQEMTDLYPQIAVLR